MHSWGVTKGIIGRHMRWWFQHPILDCEGKLTLGYTYPNLIMCEGYNAPGSPYWAMKSFLVLALGEEHPFWQAEEEPLPQLDARKRLPHAYMLVDRRDPCDVTAYTAGQYADWEPAHADANTGSLHIPAILAFPSQRGAGRCPNARRTPCLHLCGTIWCSRGKKAAGRKLERITYTRNGAPWRGF